MANENVSISKTNEKQGKRLERKRAPGGFITGIHPKPSGKGLTSPYRFGG
jgi:hypothetical protein